MEYKFRQPIMDVKGNFKEWFYWGFIDGQFIQPAIHLNGNDTRNESDICTGLCDKNGIYVYSNDYVKHGDAIFIIKYNNGAFKASYVMGDLGVRRAKNISCGTIIKKFEVVGNKYQRTF